MVILDDEIKTILNGVFLFSLKKEQNVFSFQKNPKNVFYVKNPKKTGGLIFLKKNGFFATLILVDHYLCYCYGQSRPPPLLSFLKGRGMPPLSGVPVWNGFKYCETVSSTYVKRFQTFSAVPVWNGFKHVSNTTLHWSTNYSILLAINVF